MPLTPSEALVTSLCQRSFLKLWSESNPKAPSGKELCDVLVTCGEDVILISVKEIGLKDTGDASVDWERWRRKAIDESVKQIYGAERSLQSASRVVRADGSTGLALPLAGTRRIHRIAVAIGGTGKVPYFQGDFGKGFVHVFDETTLPIVLGELDTITDFVAYLSAKEALLTARVLPLMEGQEEDLLALYIHQGRKFPADYDLMVVGANLWETLTAKPEWKLRKEADRESYVWDGLIETLYELHDPKEASAQEALDSIDAALHVMARETRFCRRVLAAGFNEFMHDAAAEKVRARMMPSLSDVRYVFLASARDESRYERRRELSLRCFVARGMMQRGDTVVGLATERYAPGAGFSFDAVRLTKPSWTIRDQEALEGIQRDLGYFSKPRITRATGDEFPMRSDRAI